MEVQAGAVDLCRDILKLIHGSKDQNTTPILVSCSQLKLKKRRESKI